MFSVSFRLGLVVGVRQAGLNISEIVSNSEKQKQKPFVNVVSRKDFTLVNHEQKSETKVETCSLKTAQL